MGLLGLSAEEEGRPGQAAHHSPSSPNWTRRGGGFPSSPLSLPTLLLGQGKEGVLLPAGVGLLLARPLLAGRTSPLAPLYTGAGGTLETQQLIV